jgi:ATP-binding cassette, subfamily B, bacterial MsbA
MKVQVPPPQQIGIGAAARILALRRRDVVVLVALAVIYAILEGFGVGMLLPLLQYIEDPTSMTQSAGGVWGVLVAALGFLGLPANLLTLLLLAFIPILLRQLVYFVNASYSAAVQKRAAVHLRSQGFSAIAHGDLSFVVAEGEGNLVSLLSAQVHRGVAAVFQFLQLVAAGLLICMYVLVLLWASWLLGIVAVAAMLLISTVVRGSIKRSREYGARLSQSSNDLYSVIGERVSAVRIIKMRGQEDIETARVTKVVERFEDAQVRLSISKAAVEVTVDPLLMLALFIIIYVGVEWLGITLASLGVFLFVLLRLNQKAKELNVARQMLSAYVDSLEFVRATIERAQTSRQLRGGTRTFDGIQDSIKFDRVGFSYSDGGSSRRVLDDVSLTIRKGSMTAFVGRSGAGKSTLVDLIPRLRDAASGRVLMDGVDVREFKLRSLRRSIGFMTQDPLLFSDSVRGNLTYGLEREASDKEIESALRRSYCEEFVAELPKGLDTELGDRAARLSGGQRQRLSLARALLQDPDILILDEPTSALDSESEEYIQRALEMLRGQKTIVIIAHRLSTVQACDQIVVMDAGRVVQQGLHDNLLAEDGPYRRLFERQLRA